ncbi:MAG: 5' nucleotidase, NT5C type [Candidatus Binatia bacterium]
MRVGLDIDGVVADFLPCFLRIVEKKIGNGPIAIDTITDMSFKSYPHLPEKTVEECMVEVSHDPDFWQGIPPLISQEEWQALDRLSCEERLVFITHRYERETYDINRVTCDWLRRHGVSKPRVYFTQETKAAHVKDLGVDLFMDDRHENCTDVAENTDAVVLMPHRLYNQSFSHPRVKRVWNFHELFAHLP